MRSETSENAEVLSRILASLALSMTSVRYHLDPTSTLSVPP